MNGIADEKEGEAGRIRMTVKVNRDTAPELYAELEGIGPYHRTKRLVALAQLGLKMVSPGNQAITPLGEMAPTPPPDQTASLSQADSEPRISAGNDLEEQSLDDSDVALLTGFGVRA